MKKRIVTICLMLSMLVVGATGCGKQAKASEGITIISREDGSGTRGAFVELIGIEEEEMTTEAQITNSTSVMMTTVAEDESAIGYISLGSLNDTVKAIDVDGVTANEENIKNGSYGVKRPFNVVRKEGEENEIIDDFVGFILSEEGQKVVQENGYISIDDVQEFTTAAPKGKAIVGGSSSVSPLMEKLVEAYSKVNPEATLELQTSDSTTGVTNVIEGTYDLGMASREVKEEEALEGADPIVIATDGIAVIVNQASQIDGLTKDEIKGIYTGEITSWDSVGQE
ncbi:phosphate transport system substrate-binding protein [Aequitasia blattaphilus]|uniref:Substrate-binding domain-containing protein n=2 Tax=Aequitasia blattaphilus TaxID=2949332 RepID=A0ABT1E829_9FIRM|nr:substrate-binding domain-containing protein [Aequitasia blattaphilus]MCP1101943.1 substrate-binding domain-containing protein [Aequitasia blattaphilus]MCR8614583.1 substrate-binding domain-containing protein [Aequitasia blattaphilus]